MAEGVYLGSIYGTLEMRTENWKKEIDRAKNDLQGLDKTTNSSLASIGKSFTSVGKTLSVGLTAPLVLFGKTSMDTAMNTQVAWKEVEKVYGSTAGAFERDVGMLGEAVDELTMKFGKQKVDVLNALAALAAMGYEGSEAVDMLTQALEFATTGQMELNTAMAGAIAISKIYGVSGDELKKVLASLNTVENSTAASMADLNEAVQTAGEAGRSAGVGIDELSAMMAVLRERAIPAGEAANGLKTIFTKLRTPVDDAKDIYDKYGFTVKETNGKLKEADEILLGLADLWPKLTDAEREELAQSNAGLYQKNKFLSLMADLSSENSTYRSTLDALGDSEQDVSNYTKEMNVFLDTNATKTAQAKAKFEELKVSIGDILSNMIVPLLQKLGDLAKKFGELSPETQKIIVIFGMIAAAIGPLLIFIGTLITSLTAIAGVVGIAVGPLLLIIAAIIAFGVALAVFIKDLKESFEFWGNFIKYIKAVVETGDWLNDWVTHLPAPFEKVARIIVKVGEVFDSLKKYIKAALETGDWLNDWLTYLPGPFQTVGKAISGVVTFFDYLKKYIKAFSETGDWLNDWLTYLPEPIQKVVRFIGEFITTISSLIKYFIDVVKTGDWLNDWITHLPESIQGAVASIGKFLVEAWDAILAAISEFWSGKVVPLLDKIGQAFIDFYNNWILPPVNLVINIFKALGSFFSWVWNNMIEPILYLMFAIVARIFYEIYNVISEVIKWLIDSFINGVDIIYGLVSSAIETIWNLIVTIATAIWDFISPYLEALWQLITNAWNWISTTTSTIWNAIKDFFIFIWNVIKGEITKALNAISSFISSQWNIISAEVNRIWTAIKDFLTMIWDKISATVNEVWNSIKNTIVTFFTDAWNGVKSTGNNMKSGLETSFNNILSFVSDVWQKIKNAIVKPFEEAKAKVEEIATKIREVADNINPFHRESPSLVDMVKKGIGEIKEQYQSLGSIQLSPISQSVSLVGASAISTPAKSFSGGNTITNSPQFSVNVGVYAGSEIEKRELAKELSDAYNAYRKSIGEGI